MSEASGLLGALLSASHLSTPDDVPDLVEEHIRRLGHRSALVFLVDADQRWLVPLTPPDGAEADPLRIDGTIAGRCYRMVEVLGTSDDDGQTVLWLPVIDGTERLGVLQVITDVDHHDDRRPELQAFAGLVAELVMSKGNYGDFFEFARRRRPFTVAAELLTQLMPPLTFGTEQVVITGLVVPTAEAGGDAFDYGVDRRCAQVAIFDAMGHGLAAGLLTTTAVAAYRNARRRRCGLEEVAMAIGDAIEGHFEDQFVTGVIASLDIATGELGLCVAGHLAPLVVRHGRIVRALDAGLGLPFGVGPQSDVFVEHLEPGDRVLFYTDGVTEARTANGEAFGVERLVDLVSRSAGEAPPPEATRRLMHAIQEHNEGEMRDDATVLLLEWLGPGGDQLKG